jgi:hypothetical protein
VLESITVDEENMQFFLRETVNDLWKRAFKDGGEITFEAITKEGKNDRLFHDTVLETFLSEYKSTKEIEIPYGYAFYDKPRLMQRYVAYKIKSNSFFGNFSYWCWKDSLCNNSKSNYRKQADCNNMPQ